ncbi:MAG: S8 family serine peptidase [Acidobacteriota bacterium]
MGPIRRLWGVFVTAVIAGCVFLGGVEGAQAQFRGPQVPIPRDQHCSILQELTQRQPPAAGGIGTGVGNGLTPIGGTIGGITPVTIPDVQQRAPVYPRPPESPAFPVASQSFDELVASSPDRRNVVVIDFTGPHGDSVAWLVESTSEAAGHPLKVGVLALDDDRFDVLGDEITDAHVLAATCTVLEAVESGEIRAPEAINMSFGRYSTLDPMLCATGSRSYECSIAHVLRELQGHGITLVAAAGNYQDELFPASAEAVVEVGMTDTNALLAFDDPEPAWETPNRTRAWLPGNALCLADGWAAPAGASYATAMFTGWIVHARERHPDLDPLEESNWRTRWARDEGCYELVSSSGRYGCNEVTNELIRGLTGPNDSTCWTSPAVSAGRSALLPDASFPEVVGLTEYVATAHGPTPEADPCLPCIGRIQGLDLVLDMSHSLGSSSGLQIRELWLRMGSQFFPLDTAASSLAAMYEGTLSELVIEDVAPLLWFSSSPSLVYVYEDLSSADCAPSFPGGPPTCLAASTPILLEP